MDILVDATKDTLQLVPFLLVVYLLMEWIEHRAGGGVQAAIRRAGVAGPLVGALLGALPQCGFSAAGATLYAGRVITLGTLFAVFLSTSDELLPIMIAEQAPVSQMAAIIATKVVIGLVMGFAMDAVLRIRAKARSDKPEELSIHKLCEQDKCHCSGGCATCEENPELAYEHDRTIDACDCACTHGHHHEHDHEHDHEECDDCSCEHEHEHTASHILLSAVKHTLQVTVFIWLVSLVLGAAFELVGEDAIASVLAANPVAAIFGSALVGLIPNCAASVAIIELYVQGMLGAGAMIAGLLVSAGVGLLVLCRANRQLKRNVEIIVALYVIGVFWGLVIHVAGVVF